MINILLQLESRLLFVHRICNINASSVKGTITIFLYNINYKFIINLIRVFVKGDLSSIKIFSAFFSYVRGAS